jgi:uncharacterized membrane protein YuzA (DUF378 family)
MRKERSLFIIGLLIILLPYSGFPSSWRTVLFVIIGLCTMYIAYLFYIQAKNNLSKDDNRSKAFVDNIGSGE